MQLIIDAQLSPHLAVWINQVFGIEVYSVKFLSLRDADDIEIYAKAREMKAIVLTKDEDFVRILSQKGSPPKIIWITCGNTSNDRISAILIQHLQNALTLLETADLVEITDQYAILPPPLPPNRRSEPNPPCLTARLIIEDFFDHKNID